MVHPIIAEIDKPQSRPFREQPSLQIENGLIWLVCKDLRGQTRGFRIGVLANRDGRFPLFRKHDFPAEKILFASSRRRQYANFVASGGHALGACVADEVKGSILDLGGDSKWSSPSTFGGIGPVAGVLENDFDQYESLEITSPPAGLISQTKMDGAVDCLKKCTDPSAKR